MAPPGRQKTVKSRIGAAFELRDKNRKSKCWSGARDLNPGPHGPELCDISSRFGGNDRFQFESFYAASRSVQICSVFPLDYYMNYSHAACRQLGCTSVVESTPRPVRARG